MIFWDSSALVALLVSESESEVRHSQLEADSSMAVWWATPVECESALQRRLREGVLTLTGVRLSRDRLKELSDSWHEVNPTPGVRSLALRLLRTHPLRAADALQLAAALALDQAAGTGVRFACSDERLSLAAETEGLVCL
jgi:predicted nucleic acid-binding protein